MLTVIDLQGNHYTAISNVPRVQRVNGEREITLSFLRGDINDKFIADIETGWTANFKGDKYHLFNEREDQHGNKEFDAVLDFFHHFNGRWHMDDVEDKSMTIDDSIRPLFDDSPYVLSIIDNFYANTMNYSKQQNSTERFLYFIGRHNAEFNIPIGTQTVQVRNKIGVQRNDVFIHEDDNLVDFNITTDTGSFCTAIKGYYRFRVPAGSGDSTEKEPTRTYDYISPMASKYGVIWGEPIHDERFDTLAGIQAATKQKQEATWKSSFEIAAERFDTPLNIGDEVRFVVPSKSINGYIRVVEINEQFDEEGDLIEATYTFGNENIANQYRKMQYDAIQDISDIMLGKKPIPFSVLPKAVREATNVINAGDSTQFYYRDDGIYGYNTQNPLGVTRYNANGIGFSQDGGQNYTTAMTYLGIVADAITAGTIDTNNITIYGDRGTNRIEITGDKIKVWDSTKPDVYTEISKGRIHANKGALSVSGFDTRELIIDGIMRGQQVANIQQFNLESMVHFDRDMFLTNDTYHPCYVIWDNFKGRYLDLTGTVRLGSTSSHNWRWVEIQITEVGSHKVAATLRKEAHKTQDPEIYSWELRIDLQQFFGTVVDYRKIFFYVNFRLLNAYDTNTALARVNQGGFYG